jgi:ribosomal protein L16 Arg81 hydroxylase
MDQATLDSVIAKTLGRDTKKFVEDYWGRRPLYVPGAGIDCAGLYGIDDFLADMVATQTAPYAAVSVKDGDRIFSLHPTPEELRTAIGKGGVASMKISRQWHRRNLPEGWLWMRALFGSLCRSLAMVYLSSGKIEDVDIFLAGPTSALGRHYDMTHVFTIQVLGERKWVFEEEVRLKQILAGRRDPRWNPAKEADFQGPIKEVILRPGDAFYVPAYAVHQVTGVTWSVSLSLGLRAFNEIDFLSHLLDLVQLTKYAELEPLPSVPEAAGAPHVQAKMELVKRVRALLKQLESATVGSALGPLRLPATLGPLGSEVDESSLGQQDRFDGSRPRFALPQPSSLDSQNYVYER